MRVLLINPWHKQDENVRKHNLSYEWRNGPYSLILLATILRHKGHKVELCDLSRKLVSCEGNVEYAVGSLSFHVLGIKPDIVGIGFMSSQKEAVRLIIQRCRRFCDTLGLGTIFIGGGIHATVEPQETQSLGFDYVFKGIADKGIVQLAEGVRPSEIQGIAENTLGEETENLDSLPFPDWSFVDYDFYKTPSYTRMRIRQTSSLDMITSRGCVWHCNFCAYNALSKVRFYSADYLVSQMDYMKHFGTNGIYFADSSIGNNRKLLREFCEALIRAKLDMEWYANIRVDQVNEDLLKLMWRAGCRLLLYGFESGSQRVLDLMNKKVSVEDNYRVAELHNKLGFPYNASIIIGYPGETVYDVRQTITFLHKVRPTAVGINKYRLIPGSPDYTEHREPSPIPEWWRWRAMWEGYVRPLNMVDRIKLGMRVLS